MFTTNKIIILRIFLGIDARVGETVLNKEENFAEKREERNSKTRDPEDIMTGKMYI